MKIESKKIKFKQEGEKQDEEGYQQRPSKILLLAVLLLVSTELEKKNKKDKLFRDKESSLHQSFRLKTQKLKRPHDRQQSASFAGKYLAQKLKSSLQRLIQMHFQHDSRFIYSIT